MGAACRAYLDYIKSGECTIHQKPKFIRTLYRLIQKMSPSLCEKTLQRAREYRIDSIASIERIAAQLLKQHMQQFPDIPLANHYEHRKTYQQGRFSTEADLNTFQQLLEDQHDE